MLALPEAVIRFILTNWIGLKSVIRLDTAFCNRSRAAFLSCAYGIGSVYTLRRYHFTNYVRCAVWSLLRDAKLDAVLLDLKLASDGQLRKRFLSSQRGHVRRVEIHEDLHHSCGHILRDIAKWCRNIEEMSVYGNQTEVHAICDLDNGLRAFKKACGQLRRLTIRYLPVSAKALSSMFTRCGVLQILSIDYSTVPLPAEVAIPSLTYLDITNAVVPEATMIAIGARCFNLQELYVFQHDSEHKGHTVTNAGVHAVLEGCPLLVATDVAYAADISTELRVELAGRCNLKELTFSAWSDSSDQLAQGVLKASPALTKVSFDYCSWLTGTTLAVCAVHCPLLEVSLVNESALPSEALVLLFKAGSKLRMIVWSNCCKLDDLVGLATAEHCPLLRTRSTVQDRC
jgi:hypothetical protein